MGQRGRELIDGRYRILRELGRGGMGVVYLALDANLNREVALKLIAPEHVRHEGAIASFQREAQAIARVRNHHVVQVHAFGRCDDSFFFSMEYVPGKTLGAEIDEHLERDQVIPRARALEILKQLAQGLDAVHAAQTVHRDIKPDNVILEEGTGRPVLIDFGLAVTGRTRTAAAVGITPQYAAPEQARGDGELDARTDVYSFATMAFELLSGRLPFEASSSGEYLKKQAFERPPRISEADPELAVVDDIFERALAKDALHRYPSCGTLVAALEGRFDQTDASWTVLPRSDQKATGAFRAVVATTDAGLARLIGRAIAITFHGIRTELAIVEPSYALASAFVEQRPGLLVLDLDAMRLDEIDAYRQLRRGDKHRVDTLAISSDPERDRRRLGPTSDEAMITKPLTLPSLLATFERLAVTNGWRRTLVPRRDDRDDPRATGRRSRPSFS